MIRQPCIGIGNSNEYTKVKAISEQDIKPRFVYRPPDGGGEYPIKIEGNLVETPCQSGSVAILGITHSKFILPAGSEYVIEVTLEGNTLVLSAGTMAVTDGSAGSVVT